jgi:hypothetical protein
VTYRALPVVAIAAACAALAAPNAMTPNAEAAFGDHALRAGAHGHDVRVLQRWLTLVGFRTRVDGAYGRRTVAAVRRYERANGLHVDGRVSRAQARGLRRRAHAAHAAQQGSPPAAAPAAGTATLAPDGRTAVAPAGAPAEVVAAIAAANDIVDRPYRYGGGHRSFKDTAYDCSGTVSYALHGAGLLSRPLDSSSLESWGAAGKGDWITVYANAGHAFVVIAGLRLDTSGAGESGPRWRPQPRSGSGYVARHPAGL